MALTLVTGLIGMEKLRSTLMATLLEFILAHVEHLEIAPIQLSIVTVILMTLWCKRMMVIHIIYIINYFNSELALKKDSLQIWEIFQSQDSHIMDLNTL